MNRLKNRIVRLLQIDDAEYIGRSDAELNRIDKRWCISECLDLAEEVYDASLEDIIDAIKHSSECQLENCENKLCSLFKSYLFKDVNGLARFIPLPFMCCLQFHVIYLCKDEMCPVPSPLSNVDCCWAFKQKLKAACEIRNYYANENRDISTDYNNNDE